MARYATLWALIACTTACCATTSAQSPADAALQQLGLHQYAPLFERNDITDLRNLSLLDNKLILEELTRLGITSPGHRLKILGYVKEQHQQEADPADNDAARTAAVVAELIDQKLEENNRNVLTQVAAMIAEARPSTGSTAVVQPPIAQDHDEQRQRRLESNDEETAANLESASMWVEQAGGKVCFGQNAAVNLHRPANGEKVLATSGGFRVGEVDDLTCGTEQTGTLRWFAAKKSLQVCEGSSEKWKAAGGAVLDAADEEACTADTPGALMWTNTAGQQALAVCDGVDTYTGVLLAAPSAGTAAPWVIVSTDTTNAAGWHSPGNVFCAPGPDECDTWHSDGGATGSYVQVETEPFVAGELTVKSIGGKDPKDDVWEKDDGYYKIEGSTDGASWTTLVPGVDWAARFTPDNKWTSLAPDAGAIAHVRLTKVGAGGGPWMAGVFMRSVPNQLLEVGTSSLSFRGGIRPGYSTTCGSGDAGTLRWAQAVKTLQICSDDEWVAVYEPPPPKKPECSGAVVVTRTIGAKEYLLCYYLESGSLDTLDEMSGVAYLVVGGGGGGGGRHSGGGGGGGVVHVQGAVLPASSYNIVVGAGGARCEGDVQGNHGHSSEAFGETALGGGTSGAYTGSVDNQKLNGGSGCGASDRVDNTNKGP